MTYAFSRAAKSLLLGSVAACLMQAATVTYTLSNLTRSGGDPIYNVASDVTFTNLSLSQVFADGVMSSVPLFGPGNVPQTFLDISTLDLTSAAQADSSALHGALLVSVLTGNVSQTNLSLLTSFGGVATPIIVNPNFIAALPLSGSSVNVNATDPTGKTYALGVLDQVRSAVVATPEPGTFAIAAVGMLTLMAAVRRFGKDAL